MIYWIDVKIHFDVDLESLLWKRALAKKKCPCVCMCIDVFFFIFISSWFYITILCRIRFIRLPFFPFIFFFTNGRIDCPLPFLSNFSRVSEIHNYDLVRVFFFSFLSFFFFLIRFQKTISTRDKKKKRKEKQATRYCM